MIDTGLDIAMWLTMIVAVPESGRSVHKDISDELFARAGIVDAWSARCCE